ncbi:MAG: hypothetical protein ABIJ44_09030 [Pseudomonadota bacterium]
MEARGRNGWFKAARCLVRTAANLEGTETETRISFYSRQMGDMPPIMLIGTRQEMETMLEKTLKAVRMHPADCPEEINL